MRNGLRCALAAWSLVTAPVFGQSFLPSTSPKVTLEFRDPTTTAAPPLAVPAAPKVTSNAALDFKDPALVETNPALADLSWKCPCTKPYRIWASSEYLLWWVKGAPLPVPLVTTGDPLAGFPFTNSAGAIGQQGTQVLLGNSSQAFGPFSGTRFTLGGWIGPDRKVGLEGSGFLLETRTTHFAASSDSNGFPALYFPAFDVQSGAERALQIADPLRGFAGDVFVTSTLQIWGAEMNGVINLWRKPGQEVSMLLGFRYMDLRESLDIHNNTTDLFFLNEQTINDHFHTRNQFYGGQLGLRASLERNRFTLDVTGKVALGVTHQVVDVQGDSTETALPGGFAPAPGSFPGGFFAQPSNIGRRTANEFTVLPSLGLKFGYQITQNIRTFIGYDVLYWNQVVRPGNQIDHNVNLSQSGMLGGGALVGPAAPAPIMQRTDFWAQGATVGFEVRY